MSNISRLMRIGQKAQGIGADEICLAVAAALLWHIFDETQDELPLVVEWETKDRNGLSPALSASDRLVFRHGERSFSILACDMHQAVGYSMLKRATIREPAEERNDCGAKKESANGEKGTLWADLIKIVRLRYLQKRISDYFDYERTHRMFRDTPLAVSGN